MCDFFLNYKNLYRNNLQEKALQFKKNHDAGSGMRSFMNNSQKGYS